MKQFEDIYKGKRVLITGHTGFKGSWLNLWLEDLGALVSGVALPTKEQPNHWGLLNFSSGDHRFDIRSLDKVKLLFTETQPEIVFHLAAQPLVRQSYKDPIETFSSNVMGTANVLEACRLTESVRAIVVVTTDKCYENREWQWGYRENDRLGGHDPYSASKAAAELVASSYRSAFFNIESAPLLATARAGNVIGGGDWSEDRLIPDLVRAIKNNQSLEIRAPMSTRPWQHVLESISGYLLLGQKLLMRKKEFAEAWNFGPEKDGNQTVKTVLIKLSQNWEGLHWHETDKAQPYEANFLYIDSSKARNKLGWQTVWNFDTNLEKTSEWYRELMLNNNVISRQQLTAYLNAAADVKCEWIK